MNIGFDAKRAFHNSTGLGNYSRTLIQSLSTTYPSEQFYLFNPKKSKRSFPFGKNCTEINPHSLLHRMLPSLWRSKGMLHDIEKYTSLFHGLSNELPYGIHKSSVKKVVTIHDLIFEHFPINIKRMIGLFIEKRFVMLANMQIKLLLSVKQQSWT